jgi:hypothetical protein
LKKSKKKPFCDFACFEEEEEEAAFEEEEEEEDDASEFS